MLRCTLTFYVLRQTNSRANSFSSRTLACFCILRFPLFDVPLRCLQMALSVHYSNAFLHGVHRCQRYEGMFKIQ